jgi:membrane protein
MRERINHYIWDYDACDPGTPRSSWRHFLQILWMVLRDLMGGMVTLRAMSLVYTTLLSIVPLLAVSISVLKGFGVHDQLEPTLAQILAPIGEQSAEISARIVGFVENMKIGVLGAVGLLLLLYTAITLIQKIESAFNHTWRLQGSRSLMQRFSDYLSVIMVGPVLVFSAVGITASLGNNHVVELLNSLPYMNNLLWLGGKLLPFVLVIAAFTFIYLMVPNTRVQFRSAGVHDLALPELVDFADRRQYFVLSPAPRVPEMEEAGPSLERTHAGSTVAAGDVQYRASARPAIRAGSGP